MTRKRKIILTVVATPFSAILLLIAFACYELHFAGVEPAAKGTIRVACVGDSITFGNPFLPKDRYPDQLQGLLGDRYSVRNFGAPSYTAQKSGDHPYWEHRYFDLSTKFSPDIVLIELGANDSKPQNWAGAERFSADYRALIQHYQSLPTKPRIILLTPPSNFLNDRQELPGGVNAKVVIDIVEKTKEIGAKLALSVIDVHAITAPHGEFFQADGLHPNGDGQRLISTAAFNELSRSGR